MQPQDTNRVTAPAQAETLAFRALAWTLGEPSRAERLLALTGLDADGLRARAADPALLAAVIEFLGNHEPDLEVCAASLDVSPATLVDAGRRLAA